MTTASFSVEGELLNLLRAGDDDAYVHVVRKHTGRLLALARGFLRNEDDAADAVQDAFLSMCKSLDRFEGNSTVATWLHRIVVNNCLMKLRSKSRRKSYSIDEFLPTFDDTGHHAKPISAWTETSRDSLADDEARRQVRECIDELPEDYRAVLVLRDIEEFDTERTAAILGVNPGAVKTRLHRARQALRTLLAPYMDQGLREGY
jgi:RNA polymerase sigma-70 factor (ECF subfamily)